MNCCQPTLFAWRVTQKALFRAVRRIVADFSAGIVAELVDLALC